jgi:hypothetical protein
MREFDLYVATESNPTLRKYGTYNISDDEYIDNNGCFILNLPISIKSPTQISFVVKSADEDYVSCSEMIFAKKNDLYMDNSKLLEFFTDLSCSQLRNDISEMYLWENLNNVLLLDMALMMIHGDYDPLGFKVQDYKAWRHPSVTAELNRTSKYSLHDNPTGIYASANEKIIAFVDDVPNNVKVSLFVQDINNKVSGYTQELKPGINGFTSPCNGLMYVMYHTNTGTEKSVRINIVTGSVNGYFDKNKHTKADWQKLLSNATFKHFDLVGEHAHLTFETNAFRQFTPDGLALINAYDDMVRIENDFMGLTKYSRDVKNRAYFLGVYGSYMYATDYYMGFNVSTQKDLLNVKEFMTSSVWGPSHEMGHVNQIRPAFRWQGMTEVTNNILALTVQTSWGNESRLITSDYYNKAYASIMTPKAAHNSKVDVFQKLVPFWQLKLYMHDVLGTTDFYKDIAELARKTPSMSDGQYQLQFVKNACDVAKLDLTDFFQKWGFLTAADVVLDDYGSRRFVVTQDQVDECIRYIQNKGYDKPQHEIQYITDSNINLYKSFLFLNGFNSVKYVNGEYIIDGWNNVVAYEVIDKKGNNVMITSKNRFKLPNNGSKYRFFVVGAVKERYEAFLF